MERIRQLRKSRNYSQATMAKIIKVPFSTYARYDNGSRQMPVDILIRFCDHFDVSMDYVAGRKDERK